MIMISYFDFLQQSIKKAIDICTRNFVVIVDRGRYHILNYEKEKQK